MRKMTRAAWTGVAGLLLAIGASGCGSDGGGDDAADGGGAPAAAGSSAEVPEVDAVRSCLEQAGFELSESNLTPELQERLGIEEDIAVAGDDELVGLGSVTWYVDEPTAKQAFEAGAAVRTEEVLRGRKGRFEYDYAGSDEAKARIEGCV